MKTGARVVVLLAALMILGTLIPQAAPIVKPVEASTGWYTRSATWWHDSGTSGTNEGLEWWRVKMIATWQTTDPSAACYVSAAATPEGRWVSNYVPAYPKAIKCSSGYHSYPVRNVTIACWIPQTLGFTAAINYCGPLPSTSGTTVGSLFQVCVGVWGTPFSVCWAYRSQATIKGSSYKIWNTPA